ncbi:MAG: helix-turn-helix domain-containing protein, partial [Halieaceae bacterium]
METTEVVSEQQVTPGHMLREAREQTGFSTREMADRLKWMPVNVTAIEENRFDSLRGPAFVRGYLRAYAKAVNLDEELVLAAYDAQGFEDAVGPDG